MLIKELKKNTNVTIKVKLDKFLESGEIQKDDRKIKFEKWEITDENEERIKCTFFDKENITRLNDNIGKWVMLNKFWCSEYESILSLSSARYGYIKPLGGL